MVEDTEPHELQQHRGASFLEIEVVEPWDWFHAEFMSPAEVVNWAREQYEFWESEKTAAIQILSRNGFNNFHWQGALFPDYLELSKAAQADGVALVNPQGTLLLAGNNQGHLLQQAAEKIIERIRSGEVLARESFVGRRILALKDVDDLGFALALFHNGRPFYSIGLGDERGVEYKKVPLRALLVAHGLRYPPNLHDIDIQTTSATRRLKDIDDLYRSARTVLENAQHLQRTLQAKIASERAVTVWRWRRISSTVGYLGLLATVIGAFGGLGLLAYFIATQLEPGGALGWLTAGVVDTALKPWVYAIAFGLPLFGGLWIIRMLTVLYRTFSARATDAAERVAMVETLYALLAEESTAPNGAERMLILNALFRPGPGGTDGDPALPNTLWEHVVNIATKAPK